jgi:hypothetical protein
MSSEKKEPSLSKTKTKERLCPRCKLPMNKDDVLNALSHDGKTVICSTCGQIESLEKLDPMRAHYLKVGQRRAQAGMYGLDKDGNPNLPKVKIK